jgi:hypothetical protein
MRTQMIIQALTTVALAGPLVGGTSDAQFISGERALLNHVGAAPVTSAGSPYGRVDPASALLGRSAERSGFQGMRSEQSDPSPARVGAERALLGRGA